MRRLFLRDVALALRAGGGAGQALAFALIGLSLLAFAIGPDVEAQSRVAAGALWVFALLSTLLTLDRLFQADLEDGSLDQIALGPSPLETAVLAKAAAHWTTTGLPLAIVSPALGQLLALPEASAWPLALSLLVGSPALSLIGAVAAALTVGVRRGGLILALLALPLFIPTLLFGVLVVQAEAMGVDRMAALALLGAVTLVAAALAPFAAAAALRIGMS